MRAPRFLIFCEPIERLLYELEDRRLARAAAAHDTGEAQCKFDLQPIKKPANNAHPFDSVVRDSVFDMDFFETPEKGRRALASRTAGFLVFFRN